MGRTKAALHHLAVAHDYTQKIIEVMGNSAGEPPDCLHLLSHAELLFQYAPLRYVFGKDFEIGKLTCFVSYRPATTSHGNASPIFPLPLKFDVLETLVLRKRLNQSLVLSRIAINVGGEVGFQ